MSKSKPPPDAQIRIERDYHELKQEAGLGNFEGRG
jgi:SRSO17 transposase